MSNMFEEDAAAPRDVPAVMRRVSELVALRNEAAAAAEKAEEAAKAARKTLFRIECEEIPEVMRSAGLKSVKTLDGTVVNVVDEIDCSITEARREEALGWLRENGYGAIIKCSVAATFGKDEVAEADAFFLRAVEELGPEAVAMKEGVHPATLKAFLKERMAAGEAVPMETFGVHPYSIARCRVPKG